MTLVLYLISYQAVTCQDLRVLRAPVSDRLFARKVVHFAADHNIYADHNIQIYADRFMSHCVSGLDYEVSDFSYSLIWIRSLSQKF